MFERYTEQARRTIFFARYEAAKFGVDQIGVEHLLLGLLREDRALANRALGGSTQIEAIRKMVEASKQPNAPVVSTSVDLPLSSECKRALAYSYEEAERLDHKHIGTDHLLLGVMREENSLAAKILRECGVKAETVREGIAPMPESSSALEKGAAAIRKLFSPIPRVPMRMGQDWFALFHRATNETRQALLAARQLAIIRHSAAIDTRHLLIGLLYQEPLIARHFPAGSPAEEVARGLKPVEKPRETVAPMALPYTEECMQAIRFALEEADQAHHQQILPDHLLLGLLRDKYCEAAEILTKLGVTADTIRKSIPPPKVEPKPDQADSQEGGTHV